MFFQKAALRPVPTWARVDELAIERLEHALGEGDEALQQALDEGYRDMDRRQPDLAEWLAREVAEGPDQLAQSVGYFLTVTVYLAFVEAFPTRLSVVDADALQLALDTLELDEELRANDPVQELQSDDIVAMAQPSVLAYVQHHLNEALQQADDEPDFDAFEGIYRAVLVQVISLSHAVRAPSGLRHPVMLA
ncbi:MAG: hypothetical protein ACFCGT_24860 [Sandaracinaceae bacterium]